MTSLFSQPLVRRRAASARRCVGTPLVPTSHARYGAQGWSKAPRLLARRERSHAQARPFFTGGPSMASTNPLTCLSTVVARQSSGPITPHDFTSRAALRLWAAENVNSSFPLASHIPHNAGLDRATRSCAAASRAGAEQGRGPQQPGAGVCFIHRLGEIRDRTYENQQHRASGLNLLVTAHHPVEHCLSQPRRRRFARRREVVPDTLLAHLTPLGWQHINLTGDYVWDVDTAIGPTGFRPLRGVDAPFAQAA